MPQKFINDFIVSATKKLNADTFVMELASENKLPQIKPGQFVEVAVAGEPQVFLRRPFSIHNVDYSKNTISLFVKIVGKGTHKLSQISSGSTLNLIYPLGNGFTVKEHMNVLLAGGGCGIAPLLYLARVLHEHHCKVNILLAGKSAKDILLTETYGKYGTLAIATEDGSLGTKGLITQHNLLKSDLDKIDYIYTCGPDAMMKAVAQIADAKDIPCELSFENTMACGIGACLCCVVKTKEGHKCACIEGPVFLSKNL